MTIQECVYYTFSVYVLCCNILYLWLILNSYIYGHDDSLKIIKCNAETASMRLTIIQHDITVIYVIFFQMYFYLMQ